MNLRDRADLRQIGRAELRAMLSGGKHARSQILLAAHAGAGGEEIASSVGVGGSTVCRIKRRFVERNLERALLSDKPPPGAERKLPVKEQALPIATACVSPPEGLARSTLELLAGAMVKLTEHRCLSHETPGRKCPQALAQGHGV